MSGSILPFPGGHARIIGDICAWPDRFTNREPSVCRWAGTVPASRIRCDVVELAQTRANVTPAPTKANQKGAATPHFVAMRPPRNWPTSNPVVLAEEVDRPDASLKASGWARMRTALETEPCRRR